MASRVIEAPFVSIIVPVYNEPRLSLCLDALERQSYADAKYEVLVIDNASDHPAAVDATRHPHVVLTTEARPGSYAARNRGLSVARGQILAFTDADCVPTPDWLLKGVARLVEGEQCDVVAGKIELSFTSEGTPTAAELYDSLRMGFPQRWYVEERHFGATANLMTWRRVIEQVGRFDPALTSSGDKEWGLRAHRAGVRMCYADEVTVRHPARRTFRELHQKVTRRAGGTHSLARANGSGLRSLARAVAKDVIPPLRFGVYLSGRSDIPLTTRLQLFGYRYALRCADAWERIGLQFRGGQARR